MALGKHVGVTVCWSLLEKNGTLPIIVFTVPPASSSSSSGQQRDAKSEKVCKGQVVLGQYLSEAIMASLDTL